VPNIPRRRRGDVLVMRTSEIACNPCHAMDVAFCELVIIRVTVGNLLTFSALSRYSMCGNLYVLKACLQAIMVVVMPSMNAKLESAMTSPHWRRLFVRA
jgi:hypothetical protein